MKKLSICSACILLPCAVSFMTACGSTGSKEATSESAPPSSSSSELKNPPPSAINVYLQYDVHWLQDDFNKTIVEPLKKKYPHITVNRVIKTLPEALAAGETVDLYMNWMGPLAEAKQLGIYEDITPLAKKHNIDLSRFDASALDMVRKLSDNGNELYGFPNSTNASALYYNKTLFDKFGVSYPADGMTWDQAIALGARLARIDNGTQYYGLNMDNYTRISFQRSLTLIDTKTNRANVNSPAYKEVMETYKKIFTSQGQNKTIGSNNDFFQKQNTAMLGGINILPSLRTANMDWDVAQYPSFPDKPNVYGMHDPNIVVLNKNSKHKDDAIRVMEMFVTDSTQEYLTSTVGRFSILADPKFNQMFGKSHTEFQGKRLSSIFKSKPAPAAGFSPYYSKAVTIVAAKMEAYLADKIDVNTMLRQDEEEINLYIDSQKK
ncbi:MAG: transporter substrate-binding protein [Paenibacillus sp.]|jgi:multiple sugar transport system substrate-binding protein|nr:transporter substrate-binding protein [Paenibacillus sp.]